MEFLIAFGRRNLPDCTFMSNNLIFEIMEDILKDQFSELVKAMRNKTALLIVDSSSKGDSCVFSLIYFDTEFKKYYSFTPLLRNIGIRQSKRDVDLFITHCAGRFSLYVWDNIGIELKKHGFELPDDWNHLIQNQNAI